ncbi:hypothetical protein [Ornithinibacillus massiliensis]|uniref:hypothetical protein n=1 Tax=Ornithinibacillus massiliensis TaxID=1944633 RepID=UPI001BA908C3|nr:hypothetical protein [Ornithinibacillus massiliensis]
MAVVVVQVVVIAVVEAVSHVATFAVHLIMIMVVIKDPKMEEVKFYFLHQTKRSAKDVSKIKSFYQ